MLTFREFCKICEDNSSIEEQSPMMKPTEYNKQIARRQVSQKTAHMRHVHQEIGAEARAQQAQKRAEMRAIMSR